MALDLARVEPLRVCLIKPSSLGDVVHALPVLSSLRARWPQAHIAWVVNKGLRALVEGHPDLDEVVPFDRGAAKVSPRGVANIASFLAGLRRLRFDLVIDLQGLLRSGVMTLATGAPVRVGLAEAREGAARAYTHRVTTVPGPRHMVDRMLLVADALGARVTTPRFTLPARPEATAWAEERLAPVPRPRFILNVGARWTTKRWPPEHFAELARRAFEDFGAGLVAVGAAEDRPLVNDLKRALGPRPILDLAGATNLPQLAAVAKAGDLFLSNDTGPLHLALAAGARVVALFTCSDPAKTGPYSPEARVVATRVWCAGSLIKQCSRLECMTELTPDRAWPTVREQLRTAMEGGSSAA